MRGFSDDELRNDEGLSGSFEEGDTAVVVWIGPDCGRDERTGVDDYRHHDGLDGTSTAAWPTEPVAYLTAHVLPRKRGRLKISKSL